MNEQLRHLTLPLSAVRDGLHGLPALAKLSASERRTVAFALADRVRNASVERPMSLSEAETLLKTAVKRARRKGAVSRFGRTSGQPSVERKSGASYGIHGVKGLPDGTYVKKGMSGTPRATGVRRSIKRSW